MGKKNVRLVRIYGTHAGNAGEAQVINLQIGLDYSAVPAIQTHNSYLIPKGWALAIMHAHWSAEGAQDIHLRAGSHATYNNALNPIQHTWYLSAAGVEHDDYVAGDAENPIYEFVIEAHDYDIYVFLSIDLNVRTRITLLCKRVRLHDL